MTVFLEALQFLTIIHLRKGDFDIQKLSASKMYFPLVGTVLGILLIVLNNLISKIFPEPLLSLILVTVLIVLTGALHLDGLADTIDAFGGGRNKEDILRIMRDSSIGTFGVLALILVILLKISLISLMPHNLKNSGLFFMATLSRYSMNIGLHFFPYAREEGKAKIFFEEKKHGMFLLSTLITIFLLSLTLKWISFLILFVVIGFTLLINMVINEKINGLTGDTLGAVCELNEVLILFTIFLTKKL